MLNCSGNETLPAFHTPDQLAEYAENKVLQSDYARYAVYAPHERVMMMIDIIHRDWYHIIAPDIRQAIEKRAGLFWDRA